MPEKRPKRPATMQRLEFFDLVDLDNDGVRGGLEFGIWVPDFGSKFLPIYVFLLD